MCTVKGVEVMLVKAVEDKTVDIDSVLSIRLDSINVCTEVVMT